MSDEPNLDEPGKPMVIVIDGIPREVEATKFQNCQQLMGEIDDRLPTEAELAAWDLTKAEYDHFLMDLHDDESDQRDRWAGIKERHEQMTGKELELPEIEKDRLGLTHLKEDETEKPPD